MSRHSVIARLLSVRSKLLRAPLADALLRLRGRQAVHCFGDSHAVVFWRIQRRRLLPCVTLDVLAIRGATALGLANPNSQTNAVEEFQRVLRRVPLGRRLVFLLGEVDCGFLIWHRASRRGTSAEEQFIASVTAYARFLRDVAARGHKRLIICAVPLPSIGDTPPQGEVARLRGSVRVSVRERTDMTLAFNRVIRELCASEGWMFVDYETELLDPSTGLLRTEFRNPNPADHHLHPDRFAEMIAAQLQPLCRSGVGAVHR